MQHPRRDDPPTIDMTIDGTVLVPASRLSRLLAFWRGLPPGALPGLLLALAGLGGLAIVLFGLALLALPVLLLLSVLGLLLRPSRRTRF